jgi:hypothetical protein
MIFFLLFVINNMTKSKAILMLLIRISTFFSLLLFTILFSVLFNANVMALPVKNYLPQDINLNTEIPIPSSSLGFEIGQRHLRHDQLISYFNLLAQQSNRIKLTTMGKTAQHRQQLLVTISSADNLKKLDNILTRRDRLTKTTDEQNSDEPLVIWLGYSVHGDEISGANAAMIVAYYLAASEETAIKEMLANTIIVLEPSINPDGMDRFVNWVSTYRNTVANNDANHMEHHQGWVTGRTNHFWFDLNRDWLLLSQKESQQRLKYFHQYQPHVVGDFHEMGPNSSYFFQPGISSRTHPLTPKENITLTAELATFHAKALDDKQRLYYSEENFDDFYYGKGSTYPDINGGIGILFEQASARGMQQETVNGLLTFEFGIQNHVLTSLSTIKGAWKNNAELKNYRQHFYQQASKLAKKEKFNGYLLHESRDSYRLNAFLAKLAQHKIKVYPLTDDIDVKEQTFKAEHSYYLPLNQAQYRLIKALFNQQTHFKDNTFYDVSGWTLPLAMNITSHPISSTWGLAFSDKAWEQPKPKSSNKLADNSYGYAFEWHNFLSPKLLNNLLMNNIKVRVATKRFTSQLNGKNHHFDAGSLIVLSGIQKQNDWKKIMLNASNEIGIELHPLTTGLTMKGIDLGSRSFKSLKAPKTLLLGGKGISQYEAGELRFYLDETLHIPLSTIDHADINKIDLSSYTHIILVDGNYNKVNDTVVKKLKIWIKRGGVVVGQKRGAKWLAKQEILAVKFASKKQINALFDDSELSYQEKEALAGRKRIAGAIFQTQLDTSHPLAYGYQRAALPLFRNSSLIMEQVHQPFITVAKYSPSPLLSGFTDKNLENRLAHNAAIIAHNYDKGRVIATTDVLAFRGYWYGSAKLLANSLFFAKVFSASVK